MSRLRTGSLFAAMLFFAVTIFAALNFERIQDAITYHQYEPTSAIAALADDSGMSERGRFLFYTSQPSLESSDTFSQKCGKKEITTAILGCYDGQRIYVYDITDERIAGIRPTTAAHEMLHAAYRRLDDAERRMVNQLLEAEYDKLKDDKELSGRMAFYARTQPGERENELHSIIGTEVAVISDELEEYYARYFSDRSMVIAQRQQYFSVFEQLRNRAEVLNARTGSLDEQIKSDREAYSAESADLQQAIDSLNFRARSGYFTSQDDFDSERQALVARNAALESLRVRLNDTISEYNQLVAELNGIAIETNELNKSIDSNVEPAPSP